MEVVQINVSEIEEKHFPILKEIIKELQGLSIIEALSIIYATEKYIKYGKHPITQNAEEYLKKNSNS